MTPSESAQRTRWGWVRVVIGVLIVAALLARVGITPFVDGLRSASPWAVLAAALITLLTSTAAAWRWSLVAGELGAQIPLPAALAACYRSQFLNATLPGGVLGDVHRAVRHGRDVDAVWRSARSVAWERVLGHVVQVLLTVLVVLALPSPLRAPLAPVAVIALVLLAGGAVVVVRGRRGGPPSSRVAALAGGIVGDLRRLLLDRRLGPRVVGASLLVVLGHLAVLLVAARAVGVPLPGTTLVVAGLVVLLVAALPTNVAGWGPREGGAAWAFAMAGAGAEAGVSVAVLYGALSLIACLPGALLLLARRRGRRPARPERAADLEVAR